MSLRKPLVLVAGQIEQLQAGDTLSGVATGTISLTNDEAGPIVIGAPVYTDAADGVKKAKGDATGTAQVLGLVDDVSIANGVAGNIRIYGVLTATTAQWDTAFGTTGGLTPGAYYY